MNLFDYPITVRLQRLAVFALFSVLLSACVVPMTAARSAQVEDNTYRPRAEYPQLIDFFPQAKVPTAVARSVAIDCGVRRQNFVSRPANLGTQFSGLVSYITTWAQTYIPSCSADATYVLMRWQETTGLPVTGVITQTDIDKTNEIFGQAKEKWLVATQPNRDRVAQRKAEVAQKEEAISYKSFFGIPLGESSNFYSQNYSCEGGLREACVSSHKDRGWDPSYVWHIYLLFSSSPTWISGHGTDQVGRLGATRHFKVFKPIHGALGRLDGVEFVALKQASIQELTNKYGQAVRTREVRTSSERDYIGRKSENAEILTWNNSAVVAELACFSDGICDGVIVTQAYWPTYIGQRRNSGTKL